MDAPILNSGARLRIVGATTDLQYQQVRELIAELTEWDAAQAAQLGLNAHEVQEFYYPTGTQDLAGAYTPPQGCLLLATISEKAAGCGAFHKMTPATCELKRMYVRPEFRRMGIGRQMGKALIIAAKRSGYRLMRLETTTFMGNAAAMYASLGFKRCSSYYVIPESFRASTVFMDLDLTLAS